MPLKNFLSKRAVKAFRSLLGLSPRYARSMPLKNFLSKFLSGAEGDRTPDLMLAKHALSQLSYSPKILRNKILVLRPSAEGPSCLEGTSSWLALLTTPQCHTFCSAKSMGPSGLEPLTPVLSGLCSNQLSYGPEFLNREPPLRLFLLRERCSRLKFKLNSQAPLLSQGISKKFDMQIF